MGCRPPVKEAREATIGGRGPFPRRGSGLRGVMLVPYSDPILRYFRNPGLRQDVALQ
jgi:hypothetical protein